MKVVGLLSGGKDSCFNLCHCARQGHDIVALATLAPPESTDELDSYMYQTVGHDAVHLVAQAMQLPLYRREISGTAVNQAAEYGSRLPANGAEDAKDETEDLYQLLLTVKSKHPDVEAVSVGAILSNYQRVRIEHVAFRAEMTLLPLTYLWHRSQAELYDEMIQAGMTSILIKVAGIGLGQDDLGKSLHQMRSKLFKLNSMYGAHVCGEGGEYETLTLDSPMFKKRIEIKETETVVTDEGEDGVSYLRIKRAELVDKEPGSLQDVTIPPDLDALGQRTLEAATQASQRADAVDETSQALSRTTLGDTLSATIGPRLTRQGRWIGISNVTGLTSASDSLTLEDEVSAAFGIIRNLLASSGLDLTHLSHINLYLSSQSLFPSINAIYKTMFGSSPPTRACVGVPLRTRARFVLSAVAFDDRGYAVDRKALHVQGRSYWAPANIGPYSQAVVAGERMWIAGQIGLRPVDLSLPECRMMQTALALQHARRIFKAMLEQRGERGKGWIEGGICWLEGEEGLPAARAAWRAQVDEEEEGCWVGKEVDGVERMPPIVFACLPKGSLPRGAKVEWQLTAHTGRSVPSEAGTDDDDDEGEADYPTLTSDGLSSKRGRCSFGVSLHGAPSKKAFSRTLLHTQSHPPASSKGATLVPVQSLHMLSGDPISSALIWHGI